MGRHVTETPGQVRASVLASTEPGVHVRLAQSRGASDSTCAFGPPLQARGRWLATTGIRRSCWSEFARCSRCRFKPEAGLPRRAPAKGFGVPRLCGQRIVTCCRPPEGGTPNGDCGRKPHQSSVISLPRRSFHAKAEGSAKARGPLASRATQNTSSSWLPTTSTWHPVSPDWQGVPSA